MIDYKYLIILLIYNAAFNHFVSLHISLKNSLSRNKSWVYLHMNDRLTVKIRKAKYYMMRQRILDGSHHDINDIFSFSSCLNRRSYDRQSLLTTSVTDFARNVNDLILSYNILRKESYDFSVSLSAAGDCLKPYWILLLWIFTLSHLALHVLRIQQIADLLIWSTTCLSNLLSTTAGQTVRLVLMIYTCTSVVRRSQRNLKERYI